MHYILPDMERMSFFLALPEELIIKIARYLGTGLGECDKNLNLYGVNCFRRVMKLQTNVLI